jgi:hypothetical protein
MPKGTINGEPYEIPEGYEVVNKKALRSYQLAQQVLSDLDRSPAGRHKGDAESQDPTGYSQGNPLLPAGTHVGYALYGGHRIVVPERTANAEAWYVKTDSDERNAE